VPEILSPSSKVTVPKAQKSSATTPKRRRMANVLDVVLETAKTLSSTPSRKLVEASKAQPEAETKQAEFEAGTKQVEVEVVVIQSETEAGPSEPTKTDRA
jgi:flagellar hook-basal body complex protein FliE